jgi:hypothetical protein
LCDDVFYQAVHAGLDYATELLTKLQERLPHIDQSLDELKAMPRQTREKILKERQEIVRTLCEKVQVWADGRVKLIGVLDGSEVSQFGLGNHWTGFTEFDQGTPTNALPKLAFSLSFSL